MKAKDRILDSLKAIQNEEPQAYATMRTISLKAGVSLNYTNHVVTDLIFDKQVEKVTKGYRTYYRLKPKPDKSNK